MGEVRKGSKGLGGKIGLKGKIKFRVTKSETENGIVGAGWGERQVQASGVGIQKACW